MTLDEFKKLSPTEQAEAYKELSDHDKFLARISGPLVPHLVTKSDCTAEQYERIHKRQLKDLTEGTVTREYYDYFENN